MIIALYISRIICELSFNSLYLAFYRCTLRSKVLITERPLKMMNNVFYFTLKALFVLKYLNFCHDFLIMWKKRLDGKDKVNFKSYDVTTWVTNNCNTHIAKYLKKLRQPGNEVWSVNRI